MESDAGYTMGPFSPNGARLVVFRLQGLTFRLGIVELASGDVTWTDLSPESGAWGRSVEWLSNDAFIVLGIPDGELPPRLSSMNATQVRLPDLWAKAARGDAAYVSVGVGIPEGPRPVRRLWRVDVGSGRSTVLSEGPFLDFEASPDGRHIALVLDGALYPLPDPESTTEARRARSLRLVDVASGVSIDPPEARDISTSLLAWSPLSDALLTATVDTELPRLLAITPAGSVRDVTPAGISPSVVIDSQLNPTAQAGWLRGMPIVRGVQDGRLGWHLQDEAEVLTIEGLAEDARLAVQGRDALLFVSRGRIVRLTSDRRLEDLGAASTANRADGPFGQRALVDPMKADSAVVLDDERRLCRVTAEIGPTTCVPGAPGAAVSWAGKVSVSRGPEGRDFNRLQVQTDRSAEIAWRLNPELDQVDVAPPRLITGPAGARGWLYLPVGEAGVRPPVIVIPYPGKTHPTPPPTMRPEGVQLTLNGQLLVAAGYAVLYPDLPTNDEPSARLADRILIVVDAAASEGLIDAERIGLWGHSFGAWASVLSATQSSRFKAVVALNGSYNLPASLGGMSPHHRLAGLNDSDVMGTARWLEAGQVGMRRSYWADPERYRRGSAFEGADAITAPVLLIHGEMDFATGQAEQMYGALVRLHSPAALTYLFGEDHSIHNPGNARVYYRQVLAWFDRYLMPVGAPSDPASVSPRLPSTPD
ncbi:alpha/beta hydrolase family protein [Brevundimonas variabilis]|uniref:Dienelactone hydrolase n=1 Tax=Brevundimonas variabilis TaxID=74312 RepID=A0A7W9CIY3_9CAUL|nr:prolyl oligopeptidase family serine peptidase [Brevundimonas variabilis]MBB5746535.1 dienelactone hydrolase [Brevundimonas variabilis]